MSIYDAANSTDAHLVRNLLEQAGIASYIRGEYLQGGLGEIPVTGLISVCVDEADAHLAGEVLAEWRAGVMEIPEDEEVKPATPRLQSPTPSAFRVSLIFVLGALVGAAGIWLLIKGPSTEHGIDYNQDGIVEERAIYSGDKLQRVDTDRNRDRKPDVISHYDHHGFISRSESDDDFDGRMETTYRYLHGQWAEMNVDDDADGNPEYTAEAIAGVIYREEWRDPPGNVIKKVIHEDGWPSSSELDTDGDGKLDELRYYDRRAEIVRSERIESER
ncbi:MAG: DUF2007 domain-containing protein [Luteimonas sp.]|nr:DUF2007 domain-containing protein [Luteimonas sp.]